MADDNAKELQRREEKLFNAKQNLDLLNQELALNFYPVRADFTGEQPLGSEFASMLFDSEPLRCLRDLAASRASMLRPRGQEWIKAAHPDDKINELPAVSRWLDMINARARTLLYKANSGFVRASKEADHDVVTFGWSVQTVESEIDPRGKRIPMFRCWHPRDCAWLDDANGVRQDVMFRRFKASARHIRSTFKEADLDSSITQAIEQNEGDKEFQLCHVMLPWDEYEFYKKPGGPQTPWVSVYYDSTNKKLLRERPSQRFRYVVEKWATLSGSQYAYSPATMTALPDARGMQTMAMVLLEAGEKSLDPPMKATQNAVKGAINTYAAGVTWVDKEYDEKNGPAIEPLLPGNINPAIGIDLINRTTFSLRDIFYLTKLTLPAYGKTATETMQLVQEYVRANIPLFEPWEAGIEMEMDEAYAVFMEMGEFGPPGTWPRELEGEDLEWKMSNPLQDAIERNRTNQATAALGLMAGAGNVNPDAPGARRIDIDQMVEDAVRGTGAPADWIKDEERQAAEAQEREMQGDIVGALQGAGAAAGVVNQGLDAAAKLQQLSQPANDAGAAAAYGAD